MSNAVTITDLRRKVAWLFYGTRNYGSLDTESKESVDEIIQDGYEAFLTPPPLPGERSSYRWNFLRPYLSVTTVASQLDYGMPADFGGFDGKLYYASSDDEYIPVSKTSPERINLWRMREATSLTHQPSHYALAQDTADPKAEPVTKLLLWPTPDAAYTITGRYFVVVRKLNDNNPYPVCDASHNQTLVESCLAKAEELLDDAEGIHAAKFAMCLATSISRDREKHSSDYLGVDRDGDWSDVKADRTMREGDYVTYNGYTPGA